MDLQCLKCDAELERSGELQRYCGSCGANFEIEISCNKCGDQLQRLKACGAVNFWCDKCNELKSKSTAVYELVEKKD